MAAGRLAMTNVTSKIMNGRLRSATRTPGTSALG